ncbi:hypothetical protein [Clostridium sp. CCUG 7971]|uniref:hypothetical protein n=1 Tax=Clostridium sp. CCUG 7971 TaxID=2811414 RepID=UPI001ABA1018|nr:hypothetical protein [Clostridium sp. CCUG 7971]MBO3445278.1 hypothetical protein [Clostridium sp. CCUG 7971]
MNKKNRLKDHNILFRDIYEQNLSNEVTEEEYSEILQFLDEYETYVDMKVDENEKELRIDETIQKCHMIIELPKSNLSSIITPFSDVIEILKQSYFTINKAYWIISLALIFVGLILIKLFKEDSIITILMTSPICVFLGFYELLRGLNENVWELELSFKYSLKQLILGKSALIATISLLVSTIINAIVFHNSVDLPLYRVVTLCILPIVMSTMITLILLTIYRNVNSILISISVWLMIIYCEKLNLVSIHLSGLELEYFIIPAIILTFIFFKVFYKQSINYLEQY